MQLSYATIRSPISGMTGNLLVYEGNLVKANDTTPLVTITQATPIYVTFAVPEGELGKVNRARAAGPVRVEAALPSDEAHPVAGVLSFVDNAVDTTTGTIRLKATFDNPERRLWPGQFVKVTITTGVEANALVVPSQAVQTGQDGPYVYVVKDDLTVEPRAVKPGPAAEGVVVITKGLAAGERVVTDGQLRLFPGAKVDAQDQGMSITEPFIRRPVMTTLVMAGILLFGAIGFRSLPVSDLPNVDFPTIQVTASLPGASPETMAASVATPLERQFSAIAGLDSINSTSSQGTTQVTLQFALDRNIDAASQDVQTAIAAAARQLPPGMPSPPTLKKVNPADQPVLYLVLSSPTMPLTAVDEVAETLIAQRLSTISGVAQVQVTGAQKFAVRARLDPSQLAVRGIGIDEVATAIQRQNSNLPVGTLYGVHQSLTVQANGQLFDAAAYRTMIVAYRNGSPVALGDLGQVVDGVENDRIGNWYDDRQVITLAIQRQPGSNTIAVVDAIKAKLPSLRAQLPGALRLDVLFDRSVPIRESVHDVEFTLVLTIALVVLVIFLFLRNVRATLIPSLAVPASIVGTFAAMSLLNFSLDNLSLMALTLSVGFVVDDAIVMLENIVRRMEGGEDPLTAALKGGKEIGFTILSMTISLVAVFIPVLFMGGLLGRLFKEFAVTISVAILVSGFVSLTLTPMLCSRFLKASHVASEGRFFRATERVFTAWLGLYERTLGWILERQRATLAVSGVLFVVTGLLFVVIPKGFLSSDDTGQFIGYTEGLPGVSFAEMARHQKEVADLIRKEPAVRGVSSTVGASDASPAGNSGNLLVLLKPRGQRKQGVDEIIEELRPKLAAVSGIRVFLQNPPSVSIGGQVTRSPYQLTLQGSDRAELARYTEAPRGEGQDAARPRRRHDGPPEQEPAARGHDRPRQGVRARPHGLAGGGRAQQLLRHAPGLDDLHVHERIPGHPRAPPRVPDESRGPVAPLRPQRRGNADPALVRRALRRERRPPGREPPRTGPVGDALVQRAGAASRSATRRRG